MWSVSSHQPHNRFLLLEITTGESRKVRPPGLEPGTYGLEVRCSIQLSYERVNSRMGKARTFSESLKRFPAYLMRINFSRAIVTLTQFLSALGAIPR